MRVSTEKEKIELDPSLNARILGAGNRISVSSSANVLQAAKAAALFPSCLRSKFSAQPNEDICAMIKNNCCIRLQAHKLAILQKCRLPDALGSEVPPYGETNQRMYSETHSDRPFIFMTKNTSQKRAPSEMEQEFWQ